MYVYLKVVSCLVGAALMGGCVQDAGYTSNYYSSNGYYYQNEMLTGYNRHYHHRHYRGNQGYYSTSPSPRNNAYSSSQTPVVYGYGSSNQDGYSSTQSGANGGYQSTRSQPMQAGFANGPVNSGYSSSQVVRY